jgi:hypothetical protein
MNLRLAKFALLGFLWAWATPSARAELPPCPNACTCRCGSLCFYPHTCLLRWRNVVPAPLAGYGNRYLVTCTFRGGIRTDNDGTYFCCNHSTATHPHSGFFLNQ